ncbi:MAG: DUF3810 domain-containing protein [Oscillospiraceae bacterium]|nr:DUF3810 domain-containing protein [Oscillospiraceae bacterium]
MFKALGRAVACLIVLLLTGFLAAFARGSAALFFAYYPAFSRKITWALAKVFAGLPFSACEIAIYLILLWAVYTLIRVFAKKRGLGGILSWITGVALFACCCLLAFTAFWGLNHYGPDITETLGIPVEQYSAEELAAATTYYRDQANQTGDAMQRRADGTAVFADFSVLAPKARESFTQLARTYSYFATPPANPKKIIAAKAMSKSGLTGLYLAFTGESCVNPDAYEAAIPYVMCHELAHGQLVASEDGANFIAYLACMASADAEMQYSGAYSAFIYCYNALFGADRAAAQTVWDGLSDGVRADIEATGAHYAQYEGAAQEVVEKVNDAYLKGFDEEAGVASYGEVADDLIAWYLLQNN